MQRFWDSAFAADPVEDEDDSHRFEFFPQVIKSNNKELSIVVLMVLFRSLSDLF